MRGLLTLGVALGVVSLTGCHAIPAVVRLAVNVSAGASQGIASRDSVRAKAAENFDCPPDEIELESMTDGYVAKGCGYFQHFGCQAENAYAWHLCEGDKPVKLPEPPEPSTPHGPYVAVVKIEPYANAVMIALTRDGKPAVATPFTLATPPELPSPRRSVDAETSSSGVARIDIAIAMRLFHDDGLTDLDRRMPELILEVGDQRIDVTTALAPIHAAWLRATEAKRAAVAPVRASGM